MLDTRLLIVDDEEREPAIHTSPIRERFAGRDVGSRRGPCGLLFPHATGGRSRALRGETRPTHPCVSRPPHLQAVFSRWQKR